MGIYKHSEIEKAVLDKIEKEDCRQQLKKTATKYIQTGREEYVIAGMMFASELLPSEKQFAAVVVNGGIFLFEGDPTDVLQKIAGVFKEKVDTPVKVLGKMAYGRMVKFKKCLDYRNQQFDIAGIPPQMKAKANAPMPDLSTKVNWEKSINIIGETPWNSAGSHALQKERDGFTKFINRPDVTDEVLQVGWDMFCAKDLLES